MRRIPSSGLSPAVLLATLLAVGHSAASADEGPWRVRVGPARITFDESVTLSAGGAAVPGAGATLSDNTALLAEIGYRLTPAWSLGLTIGVPPTTKVSGSGTAEAFGRLGKVTYGPLGLTAQYQFDLGLPVRPYVGAGAVYYMIMKTRDGAIQDLEVDNAWGSVLQVGAELPLSERYGLFLDVKKLFLKTTASGVLPAAGGAPVSANVTLNPLVVHAGLSIRF